MKKRTFERFRSMRDLHHEEVSPCDLSDILEIRALEVLLWKIIAFHDHQKRHPPKSLHGEHP